MRVEDREKFGLLLGALWPRRQLFGDVLRVLPCKSHKSLSRGQLFSMIAESSCCFLLRVAATRHELLLLIHKADRGVGKRLANYKNKA